MADVYEIITDRIVQQLEAGVVPWRKPWTAGPHGWPKNLVSRKEDRGVNVFLLSCTPYELPYWVSFKQAKDLGGHVRKGERASTAVFWKWCEAKDREAEPDPQTGARRKTRVPVLRYYSVFNIAQCEGLESRVPKAPDDRPRDFEPIAEAERIAATMPQAPVVRHGTVGAFYSRADDSVNMPSRERFESPEAYYATLFHELTHATGHPDRLNRPAIAEQTRFGSEAYSKEELVAEMGAAFLCGQARIENRTIQASASYIAGWLQKLRDDRRLVVYAAAQAQKAADFILGRSFEEHGEE